MKEPSKEFVVFDKTQRCFIGVPENPSEAEQRAAKLLQETLAKASGKGVEDYPIRTGDEGSKNGGIHLAGSNHRKTREGRLDEQVALRVSPDRVDITSYPADAIEAAAAWFLGEKLEARWFMPGPLGEHVPQRAELRLVVSEESYAPSYISRDLWIAGGPESQDWGRFNRLRAWFRHGHAMSELFGLDDLQRNPVFVSQVNGRKTLPTSNNGNWQPNIAAEGAIEHATAALAKHSEFSSRIGMNDSIRYDQSAHTRALLGEPRWFRLKPDFSPLVFRFVNDVAKRLPGRYLGAYAYDWTEDTPGFPVERNVVPYLTADRSEWFDPVFAEADKALIRRWVASGAEIVGLYDYFEGAPFIVPRPTLYAVARSIPFAHEAGVRAYFAELNSNWGLDGPKGWLAAQLLWDATVKPEDLLDIYFRDFWREAAGPMREYFARCDQQWLNQPKPSYWLKYFKDEHQHLLFPVEVRQQLRGLLAAARTAATTELTRQRVEFFVQAFAVTDAFCAWEEAKERLSRAALAAGLDQAALREAWQQLDEAEVRLKQTYAKVAKKAPLAVRATILGEYERNDPRRRAAWRLRRTEDGVQRTENAAANGGPASLRAGSGALKNGPQGHGPSIEPISAFSFQPSGFPLRPSGTELLKDAGLAQLCIGSSTGFFDLEWVEDGPWRGHGEPYETRRVSVEVRAKSEEQSAKSKVTGTLSSTLLPLGDEKVLRLAGCKQETFSQIVPAEAGEWYLARVKVRAKVSPGNMTFLILNFQDEAGQTMGQGFVDRLPVGNYPDGVELVVWAQAPAKAKRVGLGVRALNQVGDDFGEFSGFSLQALGP